MRWLLVLVTVMTACGTRASSSEVASGPPCGVKDVTGTLPGVRISIEADKCVFKVGEGGTFRYTVVTEASVPAIDIPASVGCGRCSGTSDAPSTFISWMVNGSGQQFCWCDQGCCAPNPAMTNKPKATTTTGTIEWHGRNWNGPSDFSPNPEGAVFPVGKYGVNVSFEGGSKGRVVATLPIEVVP